MSNSYICEYGFEEIPARFMSRFITELKESVKKTVTDYRLDYETIEIFATYRRLAIKIDGLAETQKDHTALIKGPPVKIALDSDGNPLPPALGFAKKCGVDASELEVKDFGGQECVAYTQFEVGKNCKDVLGPISKHIFETLKLPIAMKWGIGTHHYFRPPHWILSLLNSEVISFESLGQKSGKFTQGHRFLTQNSSQDNYASGVALEVSHADNYEAILKKAFIAVNQDERKQSIKDGLLTQISSENIDENLLEEVTYLVEWPVLLIGKFDESYLELPDSVLIQCMKKHQKYFPIFEKNELSGGFIVAADNVTEKNKSTILSGNERVLIARLEDVKFFWEEDRKVSLDAFLPKLEKVVFQKGLGSIADKVERIKTLSQCIMKTLGAESAQEEIRRTASLCKADLVSQMVFELPDLQGEMGGFYAAHQGEKESVVAGIKEHYNPKFSGDILPQSITGRVVAIADKLDTIVACFYNNLIPTGSQDPWGVRRALLGVVAILLKENISIDLIEWVNLAYSQFGEEKNKDKLQAFIGTRFEGILSDLGFAHDSVQAILPVSGFDITKAQQGLLRIEQYRKTNSVDFGTLTETAVRVGRLAKKAEGLRVVEPSLFTQEIEKKAYTAVIAFENKELSLESISKITALIETYFEDVLVMDKDEKIKANRLAFLQQLNTIYLKIAHFEKIIV